MHASSLSIISSIMAQDGEKLHRGIGNSRSRVRCRVKASETYEPVVIYGIEYMYLPKVTDNSGGYGAHTILGQKIT